jgi:hypothetical protein
MRKQTDISIEGKLYKNLFGKNEYIGTITVDDLKYDIDLKEQDTYYFEVLFANSSNFKLKSIGTVMTSFDFERVWIMLDDINKVYNINEGYVAGPAKSMKEANEIATSILKGKQ